MSTVLINLGDAIFLPVATLVAFQLTASYVDSTTLVVDSIRSAFTAGDGTGSIVLREGSYTVTFPQLTGTGNQRVIAVPNDSSVYPMTALIGLNPGAPNVPPSFVVNGNAAGLTGLTGGGIHKLDGIPTVGVSQAIWKVYDPAYDAAYHDWLCKPGSETSTNLAGGVVVPTDHATSGNNWYVIG